MGFESQNRPNWNAAKAGWVKAALATTALVALFAGASATLAQQAPDVLGAGIDVPDDAQLFLEADTVTYDSENAVVTAAGGVQVDYGGYRLVARQLVYDQNTGRLLASGDVQLVQPDGNVIYADTADITEDFADGFVTALRIETPENTRFAAAEAIRRDGNVTVFNRGVYTACEPCRENPERPVLWQVKARKIVWDQTEKEIRYYGAQFELFGAPIAYLPYFESPDPTVERKSGFLAPSFEHAEELGFGVRVPYFIALADSYDATLAGTYYTKQGFLGEAEFRQRTTNGFYRIQLAGISQATPEEFAEGTPGFDNTGRAMIGTEGRFALDPQWTFGWEILAQTDQNFAATYDIENFDSVEHTSEIYLTGLGDRSFFDLRGQKFDVQSNNELREEVQPKILPTLDYEYIFEEPVFGGEAGYNVNVLNLVRDDSNPANLRVCHPDNSLGGRCMTPEDGFLFNPDVFRRSALEGRYSRGTVDAYWRDTIVSDFGLLVTPSLSVRGDVYSVDQEIGDTTNPFFAGGTRQFTRTAGGIAIDETGARFMPEAAIEARYPYLIQTAASSHVIEPVAQILFRPDEMMAGELPNEDAQSLVFSTTNLFSHDKFSGYDRIEGGGRANVGLRYVGTFESGYAVDALVGQSYHIFGENPFAQPDLALVGADSGLETDVSDYVTSAALTTPIGIRFGAQGRFDEETLEVRRTDLQAGYSNSRLATSLTFSSIDAQPIYGFPEERQQIQSTGSLKLTDEVTAFGSIGFDLQNEAVIENAFGLSYADECFLISATYQQTRDRYQDDPAETSVLFRIGLRTIADTDFDFDVGGLGGN